MDSHGQSHLSYGTVGSHRILMADLDITLSSPTVLTCQGFQVALFPGSPLDPRGESLGTRLALKSEIMHSPKTALSCQQRKSPNLASPCMHSRTMALLASKGLVSHGNVRLVACSISRLCKQSWNCTMTLCKVTAQLIPGYACMQCTCYNARSY